MPDQPYTEDDLRTEAARQHAELLSDPDFMGIGERMQDAPIASQTPEPDEDGDGGPTVEGWCWDEVLDEDQFDTAQRRIDGLISGAADLSDWAVNLGADGLEPDDRFLQLGIDSGTGDRPRVRIQFAFAPELDGPARDAFVVALSKVITDNL